MTDECDAPPCTVEDEEEFEDIEGRNIELDFGTLEIFKERTKYITFCRPMIEEDIYYTIKKNNSLKSIKSSFEMSNYKGVLKPNEDFNLAVTYKPTLASAKDVEAYDYTDSDYEFIKITLTGVAIGPHCTMSAKNLEFYRTPERKLSERKVEITNDSAASARFKVDHAKYDVFHIEPLEGIVKPNSYKYITIRFMPKKPGLFARQIFFLVWNCEPLVLNVFGIYSTKVGMVDIELTYLSTEPSFGFKSVLDDSLTVRKNVPPFSFTSLYLDFGSVLINDGNPKTQVTSMTNHMDVPLAVNWERGLGRQYFKISPVSVKVPSQGCVQFEVEFNPEENYNVFQETMIAQLDWDADLNKRDAGSTVPLSVPLSCIIRAQGHSFPDNEGWIDHVQVLPEAIYWQPCAPGEVANTTFLLRNKSHLPALYKLIPPKKTNIIAKPMMGKFRNIEIVVVQLQTEPLKVKTYIEEWKIILNGREDRHMTIYFHGETCVPTIEIGKKNKINAGSVQDGSQKEVEVMMKNTSYYAICFQFHLIKNSILSISPMSGSLEANKALKLTIKVMGSQCAPKKETFRCEMRIIDANGAITGDSHENEIDIYTECSYSELCACPSYKDFGCLAFGQKIKSEFEAVNFGDTNIYFQTCQTGDEQIDNNFRIKPCFGEVKPKGGKRFSITGIISKVGNQTLKFGYYNRMIKDSPLVTGDPITFFKLTYCAEFPIIQIEEIVEHNFGNLFGKYDLYQYFLEVPKLNQIFRDINNDETIEVNLRMPEFLLQEKEFYIMLALTNITDFDTTVNLKRKKICDCILEEISAGMSERKKGFNCPHRASLNMELQDTRFFPKSTRFLTIKIKYCIKKETQMSYILQMTNNRIVELYFTIYSIPPETPRLSTYSKDFALMLDDIYIGTKIAPVQMYWMYNNTNNLLNVEFDIDEVEHMCRIDGYRVLEILNPLEQIIPKQMKALLVKFHPIEVKTYSVEISVKYYFPGKPSIKSKFVIEGSGVMDVTVHSTTENIPSVGKFTGHFPVSLSLEYLQIKLLPVWSRRKELIFIKNVSRGKIIQYNWGSVKIDNIIEISTETSYSLLEPKQIQPVILTIKTFSKPCIATLLLPCEIVYYSDRVAHEISKEKNKIAENRIDLFMHGEPIRAKRPKNPIQVCEEPETLFAAIVIKITTIYTKDLDENMDTSIQIKQYPNQSVENIPKSLLKKYYPEEYQKFPETKKLLPIITINQRITFCRLLEDMLSEILFGKLLKNLLEKSLKAPLLKYQEFVMSDKEILEKKIVNTPLSSQDIERFRKKEIEHFFNQLKITDLSNIFQTLIYECMLKIAQCNKPEYNLKSLNERIEKSLYVCQNKSCACNKTDES